MDILAAKKTGMLRAAFEIIARSSSLCPVVAITDGVGVTLSDGVEAL